MPKIHPTAQVDPGAELADDVEIGPYCVVESDVKIGPGTHLREHVVVRRFTTMGQGNLVDAHVVLGGEPQDRKFRPSSVSYLKIGDGNVFREGVTISRATGDGCETIIGNGNYFMACSHAGHNAVIADGAVFANSALVAGFAIIDSRVILSGNACVHQFTRIGELTISQGNGAVSMHVPPYCIFAGVNRVVSLNIVGLRRAEDLSDEDRRQIKEAFNLTYRSALTPREALERMDRCNWGPAAARFRDFVRYVVEAQPPYDRGLCPLGKHQR